MNKLLDNYVAVEGLTDAMKLAKTLVEVGKQVMVQLDDCNIYIVAYADNEDRLGDKRFAAVTPEEEEKLQYGREDEQLKEARRTVKEADADEDYYDDDNEDDVDDICVEREDEDEDDDDEYRF